MISNSLDSDLALIENFDKSMLGTLRCKLTFIDFMQNINETKK